MSVGLDRESESPGQSKICKLDITVLIDEQVLWLEISVHDSVSVAVGGSLQNLVGEFLDGLGGKWSTNGSHVLFHIILAIFED